jgi:hypothetical protein
LCQHANVTATVVRIEKTDGIDSHDSNISETMQAHQAALQSNQLTVGPTSTVSRLPSPFSCLSGHCNGARR